MYVYICIVYNKIKMYKNLKLAFVLPEINGFIRLMLKIYRLARYSKEEDRLVANRHYATVASSTFKKKNKKVRLMFCQVPVGNNQMFCLAQIKLRVNFANHLVLN
jgi:hypothetical protein